MKLKICLCCVWEYSPGEKTGQVPPHIKDMQVLSDWTSHGLSKLLTKSVFEACTIKANFKFKFSREWKYSVFRPISLRSVQKCVWQFPRFPRFSRFSSAATSSQCLTHYNFLSARRALQNMPTSQKHEKALLRPPLDMWKTPRGEFNILKNPG